MRQYNPIFHFIFFNLVLQEKKIQINIKKTVSLEYCTLTAFFSFQTYFFLFTWITGSMTFGRIQVLFFSPDEMYENDDMDAGSTYYAKDDNSNNMQTEKNIGEQQQLQHVTGRISSVTSVPSSLSHSKGNESGDEDNNIKRISNVSSMMLDPNLLLENDGGTTELSTMRLFLGSDTYSIGKYLNFYWKTFTSFELSSKFGWDWSPPESFQRGPLLLSVNRKYK